MFQSCKSKKIRLFWQDYAEKEFTNFDSVEALKIMSGFFDLEEHYMLAQIILFCHILDILKPENIPIKKLLSDLKDDKVFFIEIFRLDETLRKLLANINNWIGYHKEEIKLPIAYGLIRRLEDTGIPNKPVTELMKKVYQIVKSQGQSYFQATDMAFYTNLLEKDLLDAADAKQLFQATKSRFYLLIFNLNSQKGRTNKNSRSFL